MKRLFAILALTTALTSCGAQVDTRQSATSSGSDSGSPLIDPDLERGKEIAKRLEEESDYWHTVGMNPDGTSSISRSIYMEWGGEKVAMLPRSSWMALSRSDQSALTNYFSSVEGVKKVIVGEIRESESIPGRNTLSVDETVW